MGAMPRSGRDIPNHPCITPRFIQTANLACDAPDSVTRAYPGGWDMIRRDKRYRLCRQCQGKTEDHPQPGPLPPGRGRGISPRSPPAGNGGFTRWDSGCHSFPPLPIRRDVRHRSRRGYLQSPLPACGEGQGEGHALCPPRDATHPAALVIRDGLTDLLLRVHHEGAVAGHRLVDRFPGQQQQRGVSLRLEDDAGKRGQYPFSCSRPGLPRRDCPTLHPSACSICLRNRSLPNGVPV